MPRQSQAMGRWPRFAFSPVALLVVCILLGFPERASAYTDPGSGALLWQSMIAALAGIGFYWRRFLNSRRAKAQSEDEREASKR